MKVKTISRSTIANTRERASDHFAARRNPSASPHLHPFQRAREYQRALNAVKLERLFAKPFVYALDGHREGIYALDVHPEDLKYAVTGAADGEVRLWNVSSGRCVMTLSDAHSAFVRAVSFSHSQGSGMMRFVSGGDDSVVRLWSVASDDSVLLDKTEIRVDSSVHSIDHCMIGGRTVFATATGAALDVWRWGRGDPVRSLRDAGLSDSLLAVKFNSAQPDLIGSTASDRAIRLYDLRSGDSIISKTVLSSRCNSLSWNPLEATYFAAGSDDHRGYIFDMRNLSSTCNILSGHVGAIMDIQYSPTGLELATASYDRTLRIYPAQRGTSRDVYHAPRMQRVMACKWSLDSHYLLSGSDEGVLRMWRSEASKRPGPLTLRQSSARDYNESLRERFGHLSEVKRITGHRHLPKALRESARIERVQKEAGKRREENRARHGQGREKKAVRREAIVDEEQ